MKKIFAAGIIVFGLVQTTQAQLITCVPCDQLGMSVNVGSRESSISIYHSGQYMTHPRTTNNFNWEFSDQQGNILNRLNIVNDAFANFAMNWSITETIDVKVHLVNDSAILPNGNSINCLFEDQLYWKIDTYPSGTPYGRWTFIHNNPGVDYTETIGIEELKRTISMDISAYPIPFNNELNIKISSLLVGSTYTLFDIRGTTIKSGIFDKETNRINLSYISKGTYYLDIDKLNKPLKVIK